MEDNLELYRRGIIMSAFTKKCKVFGRF